jgi:sec-independent protein translocase protein TatA
MMATRAAGSEAVVGNSNHRDWERLAWMLNNIGPAGLVLIVLVVLVLFGRGRVASFMGEIGGGVSSFRRGLREGALEARVEDKADAAADR